MWVSAQSTETQSLGYKVSSKIPSGIYTFIYTHLANRPAARSQNARNSTERLDIFNNRLVR